MIEGIILIVGSISIYIGYSLSSDKDIDFRNVESVINIQQPPPPEDDIIVNMCYNSECPICLDYVDEDVYILNCHHVYHERCIITWFQRSRQMTCPLCLQ